MFDPRIEHTAELARLHEKATVLRRSLSGLQTGARHALQLAAQLDDDVAALHARIANAQPEEAQHDTKEIVRTH